jgi:nucleotide-binding universal stress UspA family protein
MAITTTMIMPPLLRWALGRIPPTGEEKERLEREVEEENDFVPNVERLLIAVDNSYDGRLASILSGLFTGTRQVMATVLELSEESNSLTPKPTLPLSEDKPGEIVKTTAEGVTRGSLESANESDASPAPLIMSGQLSGKDLPQTILDEAKKGYEMIFLGVENALSSDGGEGITFVPELQKIIKGFDGATAITVERGNNYPRDLQNGDLNILIPITGTDYSRLAAEVGMAIAFANKSSVTALHISPPPSEIDLIRRQPRERINAGRSLVKDIKAIGERAGIQVRARIKVRPNPERAILRQIERGGHNLIVLGVKSRAGDKLFFGHSVSVLLEKIPCSMLIISS